MCANLHPGLRGFGNCRDEVCECVYVCNKNRHSVRDSNADDHKLPFQMPTSNSSSSSSSRIFKP